MKIYIWHNLSSTEKGLLEDVKQVDDQWIFAQDLPEAEKEKAFSQADIAFGNIPPEWLEKKNQLKWLQLSSTGFNPYLKLDHKYLSPIQVTNLRDFYGQPVAETALSGILAFYRSIDQLTDLKAQKKWLGSALRPEMDLLYQKKVLLLGAGAIGKSIQKMLAAFSCDVTVIRKSASPTISELESLLPEADIIVSSLPENEETIGIFDQKKIDLMKINALFVNVGRGSVIDEKSLIKALEHSKIKGAVLDVTEQEPIPEDHPLWTLPNVILTQHTGGGYREEKSGIVQAFISNLKRFREGKPLDYPVDFRRGY